MKVQQALSYRRLLTYRPYTKQLLFHGLGKDHRERLFFAGNQLGKSWCGGGEGAMHSTGRYPDWWNGRRFSEPTTGWACGITSEQTRDNAQRILFGPEGKVGTGFLPPDSIIDYTMAKGITNFIDTARIKHITGGESLISFKSYEQGRQKWQGPPIDWIWCDEEPPADLYGEAQARTTATNGLIFTTFTPLLGITEVVSWFFPEPDAPHRAMVRMELDEAEHIPEERREAEKAKYKDHEREARVRGIPMLGSGRVFPVAESAITVDDFSLPDYWPHIAGIDFGWDHPTAIVWLVHDRDHDRLFVTNCYKAREKTPAEIAPVIRAQGEWVPVAWPHDGYVHDKGSGVTIAQQYATQGVRVLPERAQFADGGYGLEAGVTEMLDRMRTDRFKVFKTCNDWFAEFRSYHRKDGQIVKLRDDLMSATRYALMDLRFARTGSEHRIKMPRTVGLDYDPLSPQAA